MTIGELLSVNAACLYSSVWLECPLCFTFHMPTMLLAEVCCLWLQLTRAEWIKNLEKMLCFHYLSLWSNIKD